MIAFFREQALKKAQKEVDSLHPQSLRAQLSDGYHSFKELYDHRTALFIALCKVVSETSNDPVWRSFAHFDGSTIDGWFVLGIGVEPGRQVTYHLPKKFWDQCEFATAVPKVPAFDNHSGKDVIERLLSIDFLKK